MTVIGADLASRHGAICDLAGKIYYTYDTGGGMDVPLDQIIEYMAEAAYTIPVGSTVLVDWDRTIASWGKNSATGSLLTLYSWSFGVICLRERKAKVRFVSPAQVRKCLGVSDKASKDEVHELVWHLMPRHLQSPGLHRKKDVRGDIRDAWILCYTANCSIGG